MSLKVGELYVALVADVSGFSKGLRSALEDVDKFAKKVSRSTGEIAKLGLTMTAAAGAAAAAAKGMSRQVDGVMNQTSKLTKTLAVEIAELLLPVLRKVNEMIRTVVGALQAMSPATRETVAAVAVFVVQVSAALGVLSKVAGAVSSLASLGAVIVPLVGPILAVVAATAGVALAAGAVYRAWTNTSTGLQEGVIAFGKTARETFSAVSEFIVGSFRSWVSVQLQSVSSLLDMAAKVADKIGIDSTNLQIARELFKPENFIPIFNEGAAKFVDAAVILGKDVGEGIWEGLKDSWKGVGEIATLLGLDQALSMFDSIAGGAQGQIRSPYAADTRSPLSGGIRSAGDNLVGGIGAGVQGLGGGMVGRVADSAVMGGSVGGPAGAAVGAVMGILQESTQFARVMEVAGEAMQALADIVGAVIEPFLPVVELLRDFWVAMKPIGDLFKVVLGPVVKILTGLLRNLLLPILGLTNILTGRGGFREAVATLGDDLKAAGQAAKSLAEGAADATEQILNAPAGFRAGAYRYNATATGGAGSPATGGGFGDGKGPSTGGSSGGPGGVQVPAGGAGPGGGQQPGGSSDTPQVVINLHGSTLRDFRADIDRDTYRRGGTRVAIIPRYA